MWQDGELWGIHVTCQELPIMNVMDSFKEGVEKMIPHPLVGGKATVKLSV
jgi:hypothetical protein